MKRPPEHRLTLRPFVMDECDLVVLLWPNPYSRLEAVIDGENVIVNDMGKVLVSGKLEVRRSWLDKMMSDGRPVEEVFVRSGSSMSIINIIMNFRCYNYDSGQGCKYCGLFAYPISKTPPINVAPKITALQVEMAIIAAQNGWRGTLSITGGALPQSKRGQMVGRLEKVMDQLRESLDNKILSQLHIAPNIYPPDDLEEMYMWKDMGVNAAEFDLEVMDPAYFKAICPGKSKACSHDRWKEAQEVAVEIFGRGRGSFQSMVTGIEPMSSLVEGLEERISKGVYSAPLVVIPARGSPYEQFRLPTADWFVEANEKIADSYFQYADTLDVNLLTDNRPGFTRVGLSYSHILVRDEMMRRLQEQGKYSPGLPSQDFIE
ncbi:MAG: radical SAM protein [Promethearchaeota archaeon]